jgi:DNA-directed RNA polymerase specialized sigma24 family protein
LPGDEPAPDLACAVAEECQRLLDSLPDDTLQLVALGKPEGSSNAELAERLGCSLATVLRKLDRIRHVWQRLQNEKE